MRSDAMMRVCACYTCACDCPSITLLCLHIRHGRVLRHIRGGEDIGTSGRGVLSQISGSDREVVSAPHPNDLSCSDLFVGKAGQREHCAICWKSPLHEHQSKGDKR